MNSRPLLGGDMERVSDEELERIMTMYCHNDSVLYALTELRERREAEKAPYDGQQCPYCKWYHDPRLACQSYITRGHGGKTT